MTSSSHRSGPGASRSDNHWAIAWTDIGNRRTEHQPVERRVFESEKHIRSTDHGEKCFRSVNSRHGAQHAVAQSFEADNRDRREKILLLRKMIVGRLVAHPGAPRHFSEREGPILLLGDQFERSVDHGATEVAVMIGLRIGAANFFRQDGSRNIDTAYISYRQCLHRRIEMSIRRMTINLDRRQTREQTSC